jgi:hypothetical protein
MSPSTTLCDHRARMPASKGPLSHNDVHYLVGFLYAMVNQNQGSVVLGDRVEDNASGTCRDVDIVLVSECSRGRTAGRSGVELRRGRDTWQGEQRVAVV